MYVGYHIYFREDLIVGGILVVPSFLGGPTILYHLRSSTTGALLGWVDAPAKASNGRNSIHRKRPPIICARWRSRSVILVMKHRRPAKSNSRIVDEDGRGEFFVKSRVKSRPFKFKRRHQRWPAIATALVLIPCLLYTLRLITTKRESELSQFPPNWWDVQNQASLLLRCPQPQHSPKWNCYNDLVDENSDTVDRAKRLFDYAPNDNRSKEEHRFEDRIPHLLIFTHKYNIFDCSVSASNSTSPNMYTLAENAKATVKAYSRIWPDLHFVYLSDNDCIDALNRTEPGLIPFFNDVKLEGTFTTRTVYFSRREIFLKFICSTGMFKADLCRVAYLSLHGGYYLDVDLLVVRPFTAPKNSTFVTVKGEGSPGGSDFRGFFQAFLAAEKDHAIVRLSLRMMLETLSGKRPSPSGLYLGPGSLMEAWMEVQNITDLSNTKNDDYDTYLLKEINLNDQLQVSMYKNLSDVLVSETGSDLLQRVPGDHEDDCKLSTGTWNVCNFAVLDEGDGSLYFYSRVLGTTYCGVCVEKIPKKERPKRLEIENVSLFEPVPL